MYILLISGIISAVLGILLIFAGTAQCKKRISAEDGFIPTEAEIVHIDYRIAVQTIHWIPIIAKEYRPIIRYIANNGKWVTSELPYTLAISPEYRDYKASFKNGTPLVVRYDPNQPEKCFYGSRRSFRIREVVYKIIVGALLIFIGYVLIWGHFHI